AAPDREPVEPLALVQHRRERVQDQREQLRFALREPPLGARQIEALLEVHRGLVSPAYQETHHPAVRMHRDAPTIVRTEHPRILCQGAASASWKLPHDAVARSITNQNGAGPMTVPASIGVGLVAAEQPASVASGSGTRSENAIG